MGTEYPAGWLRLPKEEEEHSVYFTAIVRRMGPFSVSDTHLALWEDTGGGQMGMSHCSQTAHSLVRELFRDAARREPTAPWAGNNSHEEERDGGGKVTARSERREGRRGRPWGRTLGTGLT